MALDGTYSQKLNNVPQNFVETKQKFCGTLPSDPPNFIKLFYIYVKLVSVQCA
jgi:hypothetical protein